MSDKNEDEAYNEVHDFVVATSEDFCEWSLCTKEAWESGIPVYRLGTEEKPLKEVAVLYQVPTKIGKQVFELLQAKVRDWKLYEGKEKETKDASR